ncbi:hypothetical protein SLE2022_353780 [Rubroshorea leprosula]
MDDVEIPAHFLCPISLQLMRDPVAVATGITYDRDNIEKWLFSCKNKTCPVTKQVLSDSDLTPNHTLRRLIGSWCTLNASHGIEIIPTPKLPVNKTQIVKLLIKDAEKFLDHNMQLKCLRKLKSITLEGERSRSCLESAGAVEFLVSIIKSNNHSISQELNDSSSDEFMKASDEALSILNQLQISDGCLRKIINYDCSFVEALVGVLKQGNYQSRAYATMLLKNAFKVADSIQLTSATREFFAEIVRVLRDQISQKASKAALKILVQLCTPRSRNRIKAVEGGAVMVLIELILEASENRACELKLILLDQLCRSAEGRAELLKHGAGLAVVSKKILRVSRVASDSAVKILCYICKFSTTCSVVQEMLEVGVVAKLCLVLQVDCSYKTKERARKILRLHSRVWRNSSCVPSHLLASYPSS